MARILGTISSSFTEATSFESIATVTVGSGGVDTITFSSIPSTYTHLQIRVLVRTRNGGSPDNLYGRINSDTSTNYSNHYIIGNGTSASAGGGGNSDNFIAGRPTGGDSTVPANVFGVSVIDILDYANTNKYKTIRVLAGEDVNGSFEGNIGNVYFGSASWRSTSAITSLTFYPSFGWAQYSHIALYGIKGA